MSNDNAGASPSQNEYTSEPQFGLDALLDASIGALLTTVSRALGIVGGQHDNHRTQLATMSQRDVGEIVRGAGKAALKAAKEHAGTARMTKASAAREARSARATYANALAAVTTAASHGESLAIPGLILVVAAARFHLSLQQYGGGLFEFQQPKKRKKRGDGVVKDVTVDDLTARQRELIVAAVEASDADRDAAVRALREHAVSSESAPIEQVCALIDIGDYKRLNTIYKTICRSVVARPIASAPVINTTIDTDENVAPAKARGGGPISPQRDLYPASTPMAQPGIASPSPFASFHDDGADAKVAIDLVAWLEGSSGHYICPILTKLSDGTIVRTQAAKSPKVNAQFDSAGRHPDVQARLRALMAAATSAAGGNVHA